MKYSFRRGPLTSFEGAFSGINKGMLLSNLETVPKGSKMFLIIRVRPEFDVTAMRNYFHGVVLEWIFKKEQEAGRASYTKDMIREDLKRMFIGVDDNEKPLSMATLEQMEPGNPKTPKAKYREFLNNVRNFCRDWYHDEPPQPEKVDLGEDLFKWAIPERI